jgi:hypothetical protein
MNPVPQQFFFSRLFSRRFLSPRFLFLCGILSAQCALSSPALAVPPAVLKPVELHESGNGYRLKVRITTGSNGCSWGDYDAIQFDMEHSKGARLLVSLEPFGGSAFTPTATDISSFDLSKGFVTFYQLPKFSKPAALAFYICKDSQRKDRCSDKPMSNIQELLDSYLTPMDAKTGKLGQKPEAKSQSADKGYYFAFLLVDGAKVYVLKDQMTPAEYQQLETYMKAQGVESIYKAMREKNDSAHSVQPKAADDILSLTLPRLEKSECVPAH